MRTWIVGAVAAGIAALGFVTGVAVASPSGWTGIARSHRSVERFDMSVGVTAGQNPRRPVRFEEVREVLHVPSHYGALVTITGDAQTSVFWFRNETGVLRNVTLGETGSRLVRIETEPTARFEADARDD